MNGIRSLVGCLRVLTSATHRLRSLYERAPISTVAAIGRPFSVLSFSRARVSLVRGINQIE